MIISYRRRKKKKKKKKKKIDIEKGKERRKMKVDVHWFEGKLIGFEMIKYGQPAEMY